MFITDIIIKLCYVYCYFNGRKNEMDLIKNT